MINFKRHIFGILSSNQYLLSHAHQNLGSAEALLLVNVLDFLNTRYFFIASFLEENRSMYNHLHSKNQTGWQI